MLAAGGGAVVPGTLALGDASAWFEPTVYTALAVAAVMALGFLSMSVRQRVGATPVSVLEA